MKIFVAEYCILTMAVGAHDMTARAIAQKAVGDITFDIATLAFTGLVRIPDVRIVATGTTQSTHRRPLTTTVEDRHVG